MLIWKTILQKAYRMFMKLKQDYQISLRLMSLSEVEDVREKIQVWFYVNNINFAKTGIDK